MRTTASVVLPVLLLAAAPLAAQDYPHLRMGNPSQATEELGNKDNFLLKKKQFALAYSNDRGTPNWVSWQLRKEDIGHAPRKPFHPDTTLPPFFRRIKPDDYTGSGFDRGHLCPHNDRSATDEDSTATFVMTNMIPQAGEVNQKAWNDLEMYCRELVSKHRKRLYIISGPAGVGGTGKKGFRNTVPNGRVTVPAHCWKVIMVLPDDEGDDLAKVTSRTRLIAVIMPNSDNAEHRWDRYRTSVKKVEQLTGYCFFDAVPADVIGPLKLCVDEERIPYHPPPRNHSKAR